MLTRSLLAGQDDSIYLEQFFTTNQIHIRVDENTGPNLLVMISVAEQNGGASWCANIASAGGAIAGGLSANPIIGAVLSLASLGCGNL
jgi:hypothetical protein